MVVKVVRTTTEHNLLLIKVTDYLIVLTTRLLYWSYKLCMVICSYVSSYFFAQVF